MLNRAVTIVFSGPFAENVFLSLSATGSHVRFQFGDGTSSNPETLAAHSTDRLRAGRRYRAALAAKFPARLGLFS